MVDVQEAEEEEAIDVEAVIWMETVLEVENQDERIPEVDGREGSTEGAQNPTNTEAAHIPA